MGRTTDNLGPDDIVLGHFTLGRTYRLLDRLAAAREAGVAGIGLFMADLERWSAAGLTDDELERLLTEHDLALVDLDLIVLAASDPVVRERSDRFVKRAVELADRFGCRYLQAVAPDAGADAAGFGEIADAYGAVADALAPSGVEVGLEYVGFTTVATADQALAVVTACGRPNTGICVDVWHHRRASNHIAVADLPADLVRCVQLNDGPMVPVDDDYKRDCLRNRWYPGTGEMEVATFVADLRSIGVKLPWTIEVCRGEDELDQGRGHAHVLRAVAATRDVLG
jgi:sugar phosphate isomerase/epimerase